MQRARQEEGLEVAAPRSHSTRRPGFESVLPAKPEARNGRPRQDEEAGIVYTRTRTVPVSEEVLRRNRVIRSQDRGPAVDAYRVLSTQVLQRLRENRWNAIAMVSAGFREGKTLTAVNLAISLSREVGHTVLLVDADLRRPGVHRYFGVASEPGLSEHLLDGVPLEDILFNPGIEGLVVLPGGRPLQTSSELLGSQKMQALVQELKRRYPSRVVLFDLPPVLSAADALAFSPHVDATIMVVEEGRTSAEDVLRAAEMLESTNLIGTVLNNSSHSGLHEEGPNTARKSMQHEMVPRRNQGSQKPAREPSDRRAHGRSKSRWAGRWARMFGRGSDSNV
jgi:exopolysaccharide/PEP-CTERM locus tyrosine autokinase